MKINISVIMLFKKYMRSVDYEVLRKHNAVKQYCSDYCKYHNIDTYEQLKTELNELYELDEHSLTISTGFSWTYYNNNFNHYYKLSNEAMTILNLNNKN